MAICRPTPKEEKDGKIPLKEQGVLSEEDAIKKMTSQPAKKLNLKKRGLIQKGYAADFVLYDITKIEDKADYLNPFQKPLGIEEVYIAGELVYKGNKLITLKGGVIT